MALNIGDKVHAATTAVSTGVSSVVNSAVEKTTPKPATSVADSILSKAALQFGIEAPGPEASLARRALVTPFHYADQASAAIGTGLAHAAKAVRNTIDFVISSVVTAVSMALKTVAFVLTGISLPVIGTIGATVAVATSPFTAPAAAVAFQKDKVIKALTEENTSLKAQIATATTSEKAAPSLLEQAKAVGAKAKAAIVSVLPKSKEGQIALGATVTALVLGYAGVRLAKEAAFQAKLEQDHQELFLEVNGMTEKERSEYHEAKKALEVTFDILNSRSIKNRAIAGMQAAGSAVLGAPSSAFSAVKSLFAGTVADPDALYMEETDSDKLSDEWKEALAKAIFPNAAENPPVVAPEVKPPVVETPEVKPPVVETPEVKPPVVETPEVKI